MSIGIDFIENLMRMANARKEKELYKPKEMEENDIVNRAEDDIPHTQGMVASRFLKIASRLKPNQIATIIKWFGTAAKQSIMTNPRASTIEQEQSSPVVSNENTGAQTFNMTTTHWVMLVVAVILLGLAVWKWRSVYLLLTWPFYVVNAMLSVSVTMTTPAAGWFTTLLAKAGLVQLPKAVVTTYASTWLSVLTGVVANTVYLVGFGTVCYQVGLFVKKHLPSND